MSLMRSTTRTLTTGLVLVAVGIALGGLAAPAAATDSDSEIEGTPWILDQLVVDGELTGVPDGVLVTLLMESGQASGSGGCNSYSGTYTQASGSIALEFEPLAITAMLCPEPAMSTESAFLANLALVASYEIDRRGLNMLDEAGEPLLVYEFGEAPAMAGSWIVSSYATTERDLLPPLPGSVLTAVLGPDGAITGSSGCNHFAGSFTVDGDDIAISALTATEMGCASPELQAQESDYLAALSATNSWAQEGTDLVLADSTGVGSDTLVTLSAAIEPSYVGTWDVTGYDMGNGSIVAPLPGATLSAVFSAEGTIDGSSGCNTYSGPASVSGWSMTIGPLATTKIACADPEIDAQERQFLTALESVTSWAPDVDGVVLRGLDGTTMVTLVTPREELVPRE